MRGQEGGYDVVKFRDDVLNTVEAGLICEDRFVPAIEIIPDSDCHPGDGISFSIKDTAADAMQGTAGCREILTAERPIR